MGINGNIFTVQILRTKFGDNNFFFNRFTRQIIEFIRQSHDDNQIDRLFYLVFACFLLLFRNEHLQIVHKSVKIVVVLSALQLNNSTLIQRFGEYI